jgi:hypothetical protein
LLLISLFDAGKRFHLERLRWTSCSISSSCGWTIDKGTQLVLTASRRLGKKRRGISDNTVFSELSFSSWVNRWSTFWLISWLGSSHSDIEIIKENFTRHSSFVFYFVNFKQMGKIVIILAILYWVFLFFYNTSFGNIFEITCRHLSVCWKSSFQREHTRSLCSFSRDNFECRWLINNIPTTWYWTPDWMMLHQRYSMILNGNRLNCSLWKLDHLSWMNLRLGRFI